MSSARMEHEIVHGQMLASHDPEAVWGWKTPAGQRRARRRAQLIAQGAGLKPGVRALEIGCGTGMFSAMFAESRARLIAVDVSPELIELARQRGLPSEQVTFLAVPFEECEVEGPFDAIIGSSVLHHLDVERSLAKVRSLLKPGGVISFAEPNYLNPQVFLERNLRFLPLFSYVSADEIAFVRWKLAGLLRKIGFTEVQITPFDWLHPSTPPLLMPAVATLGRVLEFLPGFREFAGSLYIRARSISPNE
jgi:SAM-dependent methyltransferase